MYKLIYFFFLFSAVLSAQKNRTILLGKISDKFNALENVHIINLSTNQVTSSDFKGEFRMYVKAKDSLKITCVGYKTNVVILKTSDLGIKEKQIYLEPQVIELDEVTVKKHNLIGNLEIDLVKTPIDKKAQRISKMLGDIKNMKNEIMKMPIGKDEQHLQKVAAPGVPNSFAGAGGSVSLPDYYGIKKRAMRKLYKYKEAFPKKLLSEFGTHFFFVELKIPKEKYHHFLDYCNDLSMIEVLYKKGKKFEVIKLLQKHSVSYRKILEELN